MFNRPSPPNPPPKRFSLAILAVILILGFLLRLHGLENQSLSNDEFFSWLQSRAPDLDALVNKGARQDVHPPGYHLIHHLLQGRIGEEPFDLRLPSALIGGLAVGAIFLLGRALFSAREGLAAAGMTSVSYFLLHQSQTGRAYAWVFLFSILTGWLWYRSARAWAEDRSPGRLIELGLTGASIVLAYLHYFGLYLVFLQGLTGLVPVRGRRAGLKRFGLVYGAVLLAFLPWLPAMIDQWTGGRSWMSPPGWDFAWRFWQEAILEPRWAIFLSWGLVGYLVVLTILSRTRTGLTRKTLLDPDLLVLAWALLPGVPIWIVSRVSTPLLHTANLTIIIPAIILVLARAIYLLPLRLPLRDLAALGLIVIGAYNTFDFNYYSTQVRNPQYREAAQIAAQTKVPDGPVMVAAVVNHPAYFDYYLKRAGSPLRVALIIRHEADFPKLVEQVRQTKAKYLWFLEAHNMPDRGLVERMNKEWEIVLDKRLFWAGSRLYRVREP